jgi:signal transduction histidine kinase
MTSVHTAVASEPRTEAHESLDVLICCPTGRDAVLAESALRQKQIPSRSFDSVESLCGAIGPTVGAILLAEESMDDAGLRGLSRELAKQPRWSDMPIIVLNGSQHGVVRNQRGSLLALLPNATVLDRPLHRDMLTQAIEVCLRNRRRQYELRDHLAEREAILAELAEASSAKDEFLGLISHELRTPASIILGGAKLLSLRSHQLSDTDKTDLLNDINEESERLCNMIDNLLLLSKADSIDLREPLIVPRVLQYAVSHFSGRKSTRHVELDVPAELPAALCNGELFQHVINNLLTNADKYSPSDKDIKVAAWAVENGIEVTVTDCGPGVSAQELDLIFERFYRNAETAKVARGLGLGLTVCRRLIESQGGVIWATLPPEGGLRVHCLLPLCEGWEPSEENRNSSILKPRSRVDAA